MRVRVCVSLVVAAAAAAVGVRACVCPVNAESLVELSCDSERACTRARGCSSLVDVPVWSCVRARACVVSGLTGRCVGEAARGHEGVDDVRGVCGVWAECTLTET